MATTNNGWPVVPERKITRVYLGDDTDGATVLAGDVAVAFTWLVEQIHRRVERVTVINGWRSAEYNRQVGGAAGSNHISGTALDINGHLHWYEAKLPESAKYSNYRSGWTAAEIAEIRQILREASGLFAWGLDYNPGWRDAMHFDIAKGKTTRDVARFVATLTEEDDMPLTPAEISAIADASALKVWQMQFGNQAGTSVLNALGRIDANASTAATQSTAAANDARWVKSRIGGSVKNPTVSQALAAADVDEDALVARIAAAVPTGAGATPEQIEAAVRAVLRDGVGS